jgi:hypothetical protein
LEQVTVSRKTPLDGKLEVPPRLAAELDRLGDPFGVAALGDSGTGRREEMSCTCAKSAGAPHVHQFVVSDVLRRLAPGAVVDLEVDDDARVLRVHGGAS